MTKIEKNTKQNKTKGRKKEKSNYPPRQRKKKIHTYEIIFFERKKRERMRRREEEKRRREHSHGNDVWIDIPALSSKPLLGRRKFLHTHLFPRPISFPTLPPPSISFAHTPTHTHTHTLITTLLAPLNLVAFKIALTDTASTAPKVLKKEAKAKDFWSRVLDWLLVGDGAETLIVAYCAARDAEESAHMRTKRNIINEEKVNILGKVQMESDRREEGREREKKREEEERGRRCKKQTNEMINFMQ